jgi:hypothetical protein
MSSNQYEVTVRGYTIEQVVTEARADAMSVLGTFDVREVSRTPFKRVCSQLTATFIFEESTSVELAVAS